MLDLDDLATAWLPRRMASLAAMPGLNNDLGAVQAEADPVALKHPCFPPFSAGNEVSGLTVIGGRQVAQLAATVEIRWRAWQLERRCAAGPWRLESRTCLLPAEPGAVCELTVVNAGDGPRRLDLELLLSGRARNHGPRDYAWSVPSVPTDVFSFCRNRGLEQTPHPAAAGAGVAIANQEGDAWTVCEASPAPHSWRAGRCPGWSLEVPAGGRLLFVLLHAWHAERGAAEAVAARWRGRWREAFAAARARWQDLWRDAFTPGNGTFSGHLPRLAGGPEALRRLYANGVLTILTCRRRYPALPEPRYVTLWPRRGEGSAYHAWELPCTAGILARLDPDALDRQWTQLAEAPDLDYQVTNYFTGEHGGWRCCAQPHGLVRGALELTRWAGRDDWRARRIARTAKASLAAASQGQDTGAGGGGPRQLTGWQAFAEAVHAHRRHRLRGHDLVDYGERDAYLECLTTYAHGTAGHTAVQAWAVAEAAHLGLAGDADEEARLLAAVAGLYRPGEGYFDCRHPDGRRLPAPNLYDLGLVLMHGHRGLPGGAAREIVRFARERLLTPTWAHCLWPGDPDAASGLRADHQWTGCFAAWPALFALGACRCGEAGGWLAEWLDGVARVCAQGPFAQAYWAEDLHAPEAGAAAKCFDELTQGNHWAIGSGVLFAELALDGILGLSPRPDGTVACDPGLPEWAAGVEAEGIACRGRAWRLSSSRLREA